jgi:hyperosmotically inducible protein
MRSCSVALVVGLTLAGCGSVMRDQTTAEIVDDSAITAKVKARLAQEPGVSALAITVDTYNGVVILSGFVESEPQREKAIGAARGVGGVRDVRGDALVVKPAR